MSKINCVVYCRVSTKNESQNLSFESQAEYYTEYVNSNPNWNLTKIYAEKVSGTKINRTEFLKMMYDAGLEVKVTDTELSITTLSKKPEFNLIIVKDEKRFSRNLNVVPILDALKKKEVYVYFETIQKSTEGFEDLQTIIHQLAGADAFSKSLSNNLKLSYQRLHQGALRR